MKMPPNIGPVHFVGIGGIGMSGIAEVLHNLGYAVQGSDARRERQRQAPARQGHRGHRSATRPRTSATPRSSSSRPRSRSDNPELARRAREAPAGGAPRRDAGRADAASRTAVAIAGTHGKTTTTSLVATLLDAGGLDPTVINGGIINAYGTNARMGAGEWMVVEADEMRRHLPEAAGRRRHRHQHRSRASRPLRHLRRGASDAFRQLRRERAVLRLRRDVHRPSRGAGAGRPRSRTAASSPMARTRRPTSGSSIVDLDGGAAASRSRSATAAGETHTRIDGLDAADAGPAQRAQRDGRHRRRRRARHAGRGDPQGRWRPSAASSGASPAPATWNGVAIFDDYGHHPVEIAAVLQGGARRSTKARGHRRRAAAPLLAPARPVRRILRPASTTPTR